jgi:hypothetical protein
MDGRRYFVELGAGILAYAAMLVVSAKLLRHYPGHAPADTLVALLPMLPALGVCWAILRQLRRVDEFERQLQFEALAMAFAGTALITFGYGFLEHVGYPRLSMFIVWPIMAVLWIVGRVVCRRRYI